MPEAGVNSFFLSFSNINAFVFKVSREATAAFRFPCVGFFGYRVVENADKNTCLFFCTTCKKVKSQYLNCFSNCSKTFELSISSLITHHNLLGVPQPITRPPTPPPPPKKSYLLWKGKKSLWSSYLTTCFFAKLNCL